ncbi:hypothetical protein BDN72DRAFT_731823, partial [Pluteus cervinus]
RTLVAVVQSCLLTTAACVYRAIHPNIPNPHASRWELLKDRIIVSFYMLVFPEFVIYWAMEQWLGARSVAKEFNNLIPSLNWTTVHGHFAQMGGFCRADTRCVISCNILFDLIEGGRIDPTDLRIPEAALRDRSKGDALSKGLLTLQTSWFVIQCLARLVQGLLITELEVVTLAFAALNLMTYLLWWSKPLNVRCSIPLTIHDPPLSLPTPFAASEKAASVTAAEQRMVWVRRTLELMDCWTTWVWKATFGSLFGIIYRSITGLIKDLKELGLLLTILDGILCLLHGMFCCLASFFSSLGELLNEGNIIAEQNNRVDAFHIGRFSRANLKDPKLRDALLYPGMLVGTLFGAIHFISWNDEFPSTRQQVLWRMSTVFITIFPFGVFIIGGTLSFGRTLSSKSYWLSFLSAIEFFFIVVTILLYSFARLALTIQALLALKHIPAGALKDIDWNKYIPHL